jgi:hypothetical protein
VFLKCVYVTGPHSSFKSDDDNEILLNSQVSMPVFSCLFSSTGSIAMLRRLKNVLLVCLICPFASYKSAIAKDTTSTSSQSGVPIVECGYWLAPSSLPGTGLGMFAGRDFAKGEKFEYGAGDAVLPLSDVLFQSRKNDFLMPDFLWSQYTWTCPHLTLSVEGSGKAAEETQECASPGMK